MNRWVLALIIGLGVGISLSVALNNIAIGVAVGVGAFAVFALRAARRSEDPSSDQASRSAE